MKLFKKEVKSLIRIKISDKSNVERIVLCDTTLDEVFNMVSKIINYNELFEPNNKDTLIEMRECTGHLYGLSKSIRSESITVDEINKYILNEVTINN